MTSVSEESSTSICPENNPFAGVTGRRREQLMTLHRAFSGPFDATQAAAALSTDLGHTRRLLANLANSGWLARVRKGWYICVPLEASEPK